MRTTAVLLATCLCARVSADALEAIASLQRMYDRLPEEDEESRRDLKAKIDRALATPPSPPAHPKTVGIWADKYVRVIGTNSMAKELVGRTAYAKLMDATGRYEVHFASPVSEDRTEYALHPTVLEPIPDDEAPKKLRAMWPTKAMKKAQKEKDKEELRRRLQESKV